LRGDRVGDLAPLAGRRWDAALDTSGHLPGPVRASARLLRDQVGHYTFFSTVFAYADYPRLPGLDERAPLGTALDPAAERVTMETLGPLKALCERAAEEALPGRVLVVRSGLIVGPHDPTDHFRYWPRRVAEGGEVLVPGRPEDGVQVIDARDLAAWVLDSVESGRNGVYNATGPAGALTMGQFLDTCRGEVGGDVRLTWVADGFVLGSGVRPVLDLPLWMPGMPGAAAIDTRKAVAAGLSCRWIGETVRDIMASDGGPTAATTRPAGLSRGREAEVLGAWHSRAGAPLGRPVALIERSS